MSATPGPWEAGSRVIEVGGADFTPIDAAEHTVAFVPVARQANARLIAASPELYEALEAIGYWPSVRAAIGDKLSAQLDAALAKARGEQVHSDPLPKQVGR